MTFMIECQQFALSRERKKRKEKDDAVKRKEQMRLNHVK